MKLLVTGFGPFGTVVDNPAAALARAVDGATGPGFSVRGVQMPVSYERAVDVTLQEAHEHGADCVLGVGVAVKRSQPELERWGRARCGQMPDVDGVVGPDLAGPDAVRCSLPVDSWAEALRCATSEDAGTYVCNAWLHQVRQRLAVPVGFLHIPLSGVEGGWLLAGLQRLTNPNTP